MAITAEYEYKLPAWAVYYLITGDSDTLSDEEVALADAWYERQATGQDRVFTYDTESYFSYSNDLDKLGGDVINCTVLHLS